jgi:hypothetical protein
VAELSAEGTRLRSFRGDLRPFARCKGEVLLRRDMLDKPLIDVAGRRVVRANELVPARGAEHWHLVGVAIGAFALLRRLGPVRLENDRVVAWRGYGIVGMQVG